MKPALAPAGPPPLPARQRPRWPFHLAIIAALLLLNLGLYYRTVPLGFLSVDDPDYVQNNPYIENLKPANLKHIFTTPYAANYAPANILSYAVDVAFAGGKKASAIHLSNVLWHGWTVCAVYILAFVIGRHVLFAATAAGLFLLHPTHVEVVAWISSRKDLVATSFAALSMACYLVYRRLTKPCGSESTPASPQPATGSFRAPLFYGPSIICFLIASAGKQSVLLLPAVMLLWDLIVERRFFDKGRRWQLLADKIPFGLITLFFGWMTWHAQPSTNQSASYFVLADTLLTDLWLLTGGGKYVVYRNAPNAAAVGSMGRILIILGALLAWVAPLVFIRFKRPLRMALGYWVLVQMVPPMLLSFVVPITDRYLFLPSVGICLLIADCLWGGGEAGDSLPRLLQRNWRFAVSLGIFVAIVGVWGFKTSSYIDEWRDPRSVWYGAHLKTQNSQVSQFLGEVYQNAGDRVNAFITSATPLDITNETAFAEAVSGDAAKVESLRGEWFGRVPTRTNSVVYRDQLWSFAWQQYRTSAAHRGTLSAPNLFMNRGRLLVSEGKYEQAIPEFQTALAFATNSSYEVVREESSVHALRAIAVAYWNMRKYKEALPFYVQAQAIQKRSGQRWVPTLDEELEKLKGLAR